MIRQIEKKVERVVKEEVKGCAFVCDNCAAEVKVYFERKGQSYARTPKEWGGLAVRGSEKVDPGFDMKYDLCPDCVARLRLRSEEG